MDLNLKFPIRLLETIGRYLGSLNDTKAFGINEIRHTRISGASSRRIATEKV